MARLIESTFIAGPAGRLEALHEAPDDEVELRRAAVICHPHPLYGGTMHNKVVFRLARAARRAGTAVLRFQFRGVGQSAGSHDSGIGEQDDLRAALAFMRERYPALPLIAAGFSFGARVGLQVCCADDRIERFLAAGTPVDQGEWQFLEACRCPIFFLQSTQDPFGSRGSMESESARVAAPMKVLWVEASDHFFTDALDAFEETAYQAMQADIAGLQTRHRA